MANKTHITVIPYRAQSHINQMLHFSKRLASKGFSVTLVIPTNNGKPIQAQAGSVKIESISDGFTEGGGAKSADEYFERFKVAVSQNLGKFLEKQRGLGRPVKVLVYDSIMSWALDVAHRLGILGAAFFTQSCAVWAIYYHLHQGNLKIPSQGSTVSMPAMPELGMNDLPSYIFDEGPYGPAALRNHLNKFSNFQEADWLFFNTFDKLEHEVVNWMAGQWPIKTIGPTIPSIYLDKRLEEDNDYGFSLFNPNAEACMKWLDSKEISSVVYVSFGSLATLGEEQIEELARGLKRINNYFLWVVRASEESKLPSNFMDETLENGLVVNWCPQLDVLAHQTVGCFISHCGWSSTLEALSLGVPVVAMPQLTDQTTNAKFIVDIWQVGVQTKADGKRVVTREEIQKCIKEVLEGEKGKEFKRNALRWKELAKEAVDEGGSSDKNIEEFVSKLLCT